MFLFGILCNSMVPSRGRRIKTMSSHLITIVQTCLNHFHKSSVATPCRKGHVLHTDSGVNVGGGACFWFALSDFQQ